MDISCGATLLYARARCRSGTRAQGKTTQPALDGRSKLNGRPFQTAAVQFHKTASGPITKRSLPHYIHCRLRQQSFVAGAVSLQMTSLQSFQIASILQMSPTAPPNGPNSPFKSPYYSPSKWPQHNPFEWLQQSNRLAPTALSNGPKTVPANSPK